MTCETRRTEVADVGQPFYTDSFTACEMRVGGQKGGRDGGTVGDDGADAFVTADLAGLSGAWEGEPGVGHYAEVGCTYAGMCSGYMSILSDKVMELDQETCRRIKTSPGPGVGIGWVMIFVEIVPGWS